ncbi:MAG: DNA-protecting protein DprA [Chloroflexi bacterium]|nr:DNA-protecting protein DprA [Chloroflexota bacterium]BCY19151.1 DNA processing protein DprA [Leptolinea sp. HRD-7]
MDDRIYWIGFTYVRGIGAVRFRGLLQAFPDLQTAWNAPASQLAEAGLTAKIIENLHQVKKQIDLERILANIQKAGIHILTWKDENYPRRLKEIDQPPPVLYTLGELTVQDEWAAAIVGTRRMTGYGRQVTEELTELLAHHGVTVVSGLARGVDASAHQTALKHGGRTIAVLGSGVDRIYPPEHRKLAAEIAENGAVISDYPPGTPPESNNFPPRNRIISGLSRVVVVIEAGITSGALITSTFAAEQGRDVFALPGSIYANQSKGTNRLIQQGARPLLEPKDVLDALNIEQVQEYRQARLDLPADPREQQIMDALGYEPVHIDDLGHAIGWGMDALTSTLTMMELKGMVRQVGGMNYILVKEKGILYQADKK